MYVDNPSNLPKVPVNLCFIIHGKVWWCWVLENQITTTEEIVANATI